MARPTDWDKPKERHQIRLTPVCWQHLDDIAGANNLPSRAEAIEHLSRYAVRQSLIFKQDDISSADAIASLDRIATALCISRSELVERMARGETEPIQGDWEEQVAKLEEEYHLRITTPFSKGQPYFAGATPLGVSGFNGRPDYEAQGSTLQEAVFNLIQLIHQKNSESRR